MKSIDQVMFGASGWERPIWNVLPLGEMSPLPESEERQGGTESSRQATHQRKRWGGRPADGIYVPR